MTRLLLLVGATICAPLVLANDWHYQNQKDDFTDLSIHISKASGDAKGSFSAVRCDENGALDVFFSVGQYIGKNQKYKVRYRFDTQKSKIGI